MSYSAASVTSSTTPAKAFVDALEAMLTAHSNWQFVEAVVIGSNTHRVWRSKAAGNGFGADWYLVIGRLTDGTGNVTFRAGEVWDATNKFIVRGVYSVAAYSNEITYGSRYGVTGYAIETNWASFTVTLASTYSYWMFVGKGHIVVMSNQMTEALYVGLYDPLGSHAAAQSSRLFPLVAGFSVTGGWLVYATRIPGAALNAINWGAGLNAANSQTVGTPQVGLTGIAGKIGSTPVNSPLLGNIIQAARVLLSVVGQPDAISGGVLLGQLRDVWDMYNGSGPVRGDTISVNSKVHLLLTPGASNVMAINTELV